MSVFTADGIKRRDTMAVGLNEQETTINFSRTGSGLDIWTSDTTMMTRLDHLCETAPENYKCVETSHFKLDPENIASKRYVVSDKSLLSFRSKKVERELTEEQREELRERMRALSEKQKEMRNAEKNSFA